jgi:adenosylmethionine-8-amino-7-oxononanoate aminotransferase
MTTLEAADVAHLLHPVTSHASHSEKGPTIVVKGSGAEIVLEDGTRLLDGTAGLWCVNVGHGRRQIVDAVAGQMEQIAFAHTFAGFASPPTIRLAERLADILPGDLDAVMFASGGGEANESAFKLARLYWRLQGQPDRQVILSHDRGYHGLSLGATAATGLPQYHVDFPLTASGFEHFPSPYCYRSGDGHPEDGGCASFHADGLARAIERIGPSLVAAVIVEPVLGTGGVLVPPEGYLTEVRAVCDSHGILLISDEVITGFGRTGRWFGTERDGVVPDLLTFAKGVTSGYVPLGGVAVGGRLWDAIHDMPGDRPLMHGFTYSGHPVACAAALANIDILEDESLVDRVRESGRVLADALAPLRDLPSVGDVRIIGLMAAVELVSDKKTRERFPAQEKRAARAVMAARERGLSTRALLDDMLVLSPPFITTDGQLRDAAATLGDAIVATD